jgi:hypothetical protein
MRQLPVILAVLLLASLLGFVTRPESAPPPSAVVVRQEYWAPAEDSAYWGQVWQPRGEVYVAESGRSVPGHLLAELRERALRQPPVSPEEMARILISPTVLAERQAWILKNVTRPPGLTKETAQAALTPEAVRATVAESLRTQLHNAVYGRSTVVRWEGLQLYVESPYGLPFVITSGGQTWSSWDPRLPALVKELAHPDSGFPNPSSFLSYDLEWNWIGDFIYGEAMLERPTADPKP